MSNATLKYTMFAYIYMRCLNVLFITGYIIVNWPCIKNDYCILLILTLLVPTPQNGQPRSNNLSTKALELFEFGWPFCVVSA